MYIKTFFVGWNDIDMNIHMRNTAYLAKTSDMRMMFLAEHGFDLKEFSKLKLGPIAIKDEIEYFREIAPMHPFTITLALSGLSEDGSRFQFRNELFCRENRLCARVTTTGAWLDLAARKIVEPPEALFGVLNQLEKTDDFTLWDHRSLK